MFSHQNYKFSKKSITECNLFDGSLIVVHILTMLITFALVGMSQVSNKYYCYTERFSGDKCLLPLQKTPKRLTRMMKYETTTQLQAYDCKTFLTYSNKL